MSTRPIRKQDINATLSEINQVNQCHVEANAFMKCLRENKFDEGRCVVRSTFEHVLLVYYMTAMHFRVAIYDHVVCVPV